MRALFCAGSTAALLAMVAYPTAVQAQDDSSEAQGGEQLVSSLSSCRDIEDNNARLACYDREVGNFVSAADQGEIRVVDAKDIRDTRRRLFGFALPRINLFGGDGDEEELTELESTITRVRQINRNTYHFQIEEGDAWWQYKLESVRTRPPRVGDDVTLKKASLGSYFIRVDGRRGVKGIRVQ